MNTIEDITLNVADSALQF